MNKQPTSTNRRAALAYAYKFNWSVFPLHHVANGKCSCGKDECESPGKHPKISGGFHSATTDHHAINEWWSRWTHANIGIPTGAGNGFIAVDIDPRHAGNESFDDLISEYGDIPDTVEAITGSRGRHILFKHPGGTISNQSDMLPGIDIRGDGGYIVASPSNHISGHEYGWEDSSHPLDVPIADMPEWLHDMLVEPEDKPHIKKPTSHWLQLLQGVGDGGRNDAMMSLIGYLLAKRIDYQIAYEIALLWNERNDPPLEKDTVTTAFNNILEKEAARKR